MGSVILGMGYLAIYPHGHDEFVPDSYAIRLFIVSTSEETLREIKEPAREAVENYMQDLAQLDQVMRVAEGVRTLGLYRPVRIAIWKAVASAWIAFAMNDQEEALRRMDEAVELGTQSSYLGARAPGPDSYLNVWEQRGDLMMELGRYSAARADYELALDASPNHFNAIYGIARSSELSGDNLGA